MSDQRIAIITGAARGIGRGISEVLAGDGYHVAVLDADAETADETANAINRMGAKAISIVCDVTDARQIESALDRVAAVLGRPTLLVNNAGIARRGRLEDVPAQDWDRVLAVDLTAVFIASQIVGRAMLVAGSGVIVNIASAAGIIAQPWLGGYSAAKAGVIALTKQMALEWGPRGIRAVAICPGFVRTATSERIYADPVLSDQRRRLVPSRRIGTPEDIGNVVAFLASDRADYINGAVIPVDGGFLQALFDQTPAIGPDGSILLAGWARSD